MSEAPVLVVHAGATWLMTGLIWFVQLVHYPLMARVGRDGWIVYERQHQARTTWIVAPAMLTELATGLMLALPTGPWRGVADPVLAWPGLALLALIWASTFIVQVAQHRRLADGFDDPTHRRLVAGNWIRTAAWSARAVIVGAMLAAGPAA